MHGDGDLDVCSADAERSVEETAAALDPQERSAVAKGALDLLGASHRPAIRFDDDIARDDSGTCGG